MRKHLPVIAGIILLDQTSKAVAKLALQEPLRITSMLTLQYTENTGAAFSILQGQNTLLAFLMLAVIGMLVYRFYSFTKRERLFVALIIGGATGNLIDRIAYGHVVDFINVHIWPVFNVADSAITIGGAGLIYLMFRKQKQARKGRKI